MSKIRYQIQISGFGGQGVVFLVKLLSVCAKLKGVGFLGTENHGMSQRGGSVVCDVKVGDFHTPCINLGQADLLIGLHADECLRALQYAKPQAKVVVNATPTFPQLTQECFTEDAFARAEKKEFSIQALNIFMLGLALKRVKDFPFTFDEIKAGLEAVNAKLAPQNLEVLQKGYNL